MMVVACCDHADRQKWGKDRKGNQRFRCNDCGHSWIDCGPKPLGHMRITMEQAVSILNLFAEGVSVRSTERLTKVNRNTIVDLLVLVGDRCRQFAHDRLRGISCQFIEVDELWGFVGMKEKTRQRLHHSFDFGDAYCFTALDPDTKLLITWHVGKREQDDCQWFCDKLAACVSGRTQITTDGFKYYGFSMFESFRHRADFAQLIKIYANPSQTDQRTYSPTQIKSTRHRIVIGDPDKSQISTSMVERSNLTWRMRCRRMTRLTNGHSKKWDNHEAALALIFTVYNFVTVHSTLKTTPAVAHGLIDHPWTMEELLGELAKHA